MSEIGAAFISIIPEARGFTKKLDSQIAPGMGGIGKRAGSAFGKAFALGGALVAGAGVVKFLGDSLGEAREAQKVGALTANVIKTTGGAAKISAKQVGDLASALSLKTGVDDEAIQSGSNLLLTFKGIKREGKGVNDVFGRATAAAVDLSASGFGDINGASKQLGKALNDPIKGITALAKSGVTFTDQQKNQIKTMVESGDLLGAQKVVLGELESQVGGAAAATSTYGDKAKVAFGNVKEQVGQKLLPVIDSLAQTFLKSVPTITKIIDGIGPAFRRVQAFLAPFIAQVRGFFSGGQGGGFLAGVLSVAQTVRANFLPVVQTMANTFTTKILPAVRSFADYVITNLLPIFVQVVGIIQTRVLPIIASLAQFFYGTLYPAVIDIVSAVAKNLKPVFDQLVATFKAKVLPALDQLLAAIQRNLPTFQKIATVVLKVAGFLLKLAAAILAKVLPPLIRLAGFIIGRAVGAFSDLLDGITKVVNFLPKIAAFATGVKEKLGVAIDYVKKLPEKITAAVSGFKDLLVHAGAELIDGLVRGIKSKVSAVTDAMKGIAGKVKGYFPGSPVKEGPLTSWNNGGAGERLMDMLAKGILHGEKKVTNALEKVLNKAKSQLDTLVDAFQSITDGVMSNFASNLFGATATDAVTDALGNITPAKTAGQNFLDNLLSVKGNLGTAISDFGVLKGFGLPGSFLAKLFAEGGFPLIHELASNKDQATSAGNLFADIQTLTSSLGNTVASGSTGVQTTLDKLLEQQKLTNRLLEKAPSETGKHVGGEVNTAAKDGKRRANTGGKRGR